MNVTHRLFAKSAIIFAMRLTGAGIMFLVQAAIARHFGAGALGRYMVAIAACNLIAVVLPLGFPTIANYFGAEYAAKGQGAALRLFLVQGLVQIALTAAIVAVIGPSIAGGVVAEEWWPIAVMAAAIAVLMLCGSLLVSMKQAITGYFGDAILRPLFAACAFGLALNAAQPVHAMLWTVSLCGAVLAIAYAIYTSSRVWRIPCGAAITGEQWRWWFYALPWAIMALAGDFYFDLDILMLQRLMPLDTIAVFGITARLFGLAGFAVTSVYAVSWPSMFEAEAHGHHTEFLRRIRQTNLAATGLSVMLVLATLVLGPPLLRLLGPDFAAATVPLAILCLTLVARSVFGPGALVLSIASRPYAPLGAVAIGIAGLVLGNMILVPAYGLYGACASATLASVVWCIALWWIAKRITGLDVSIFPAFFSAREQQGSSTASGP